MPGTRPKKATRITQECSAKLRNAGCVQAQADSERRGVQRALGLGAAQAVATDRQTNVASKPPSPATTLAGAIEYAPPALYRPTPSSHRAGRQKIMKNFLQHRPWSRWTAGERRLGEIMQQQAETVGKGEGPSVRWRVI